jgi:hypothetical protein
MLKSRRFIASIFASAVVAVGFAGPAAAQPIFTGGLVNVTIIDALDVNRNQINVQIPIGVAANVCGVQANLLAQGNIQEPVDCTAKTTQDLPVRFRRG